MCIQKCPKAHAPGDTDVTPKDGMLEDIIYKLNLGVKRRTNAFQIAFAGAIIKGFWNFVKLDEFPDGAGEGSVGIGEFWPFDEVAAISNRLGSKPSLSERR
jgi:hypothetical protein